MATVQITSHISAQGKLIFQKGDLAWVNIGGGRVLCGRLLRFIAPPFPRVAS